MFDQDEAAPEQINVIAVTAELLDRLIEGGDPAARDAEHIEESVPEVFGLGVFRAFVYPFVGEF